ncbi:hypothetical protein [Aeromicrobium sp. Root472D3]|uniref:hypothetical protein n=1 Tax=Aeromicrobium sp. Root472D3 TaxID=1736540 RepID=UPI0006F2E331|nr:hypothetical protein [Aeromicrobium sp. Root472D3]KQX75364.1 hypothetical protein ASD10_09385 [Aeromicrobium sp. Root472D3]
MPNPTRAHFEDRAGELQDCTSLRTVQDFTGQTLFLVPDNPRAVGVTLLDYGDGTSAVSFTGQEDGTGGEMTYEPRHVDFYIDAAVAGAVRLLDGPGRRSIQVDVGDGYETMDTSYSLWSMFPIPGWRDRADMTQFEPYRPG